MHMRGGEGSAFGGSHHEGCKEGSEKIPRKFRGGLGRFQEGSGKGPVMHAQRACQSGAMGNRSTKVMNGNGGCGEKTSLLYECV